MESRAITDELRNGFRTYLMESEKSTATINKYMHDLQCFIQFAAGRSVDKQLVLQYKEHLSEEYARTSANSMLAALNVFLQFAEWHNCRVKPFKIQAHVYCSEEKEMTREEYVRLVKAAKRKGDARLALILQTICSTGIRVSELQYITVEAVKRGEAYVSCKGKSRKVFLVKALRKQLLLYIRKENIQSGPIFITKRGKTMNRCSVWRQMKSLCTLAGVAETKVFPHNLRHLFARVFYSFEKDIAKLADLLGHASINTTRIYMVSTGAEHRRKMEQMKLILSEDVKESTY